jgi:hypothetical protein
MAQSDPQDGQPPDGPSFTYTTSIPPTESGTRLKRPHGIALALAIVWYRTKRFCLSVIGGALCVVVYVQLEPICRPLSPAMLRFESKDPVIVAVFFCGTALFFIAQRNARSRT